MLYAEAEKRLTDPIAKEMYSGAVELSEHCQILPSEPITMQHLLSVILYTDYTQHSSQFTSTFRKNNKFEPIQAIKKRHTKFYWMSKFLQETIKAYGQRYDTDDKDKGLCGPFFTGMSMVMSMPQFNMRLLSPTSTSCQIAVSMKFSGEKGIIIEFDNDKGWARCLNGLDVSWMSRYHEEDER